MVMLMNPGLDRDCVHCFVLLSVTSALFLCFCLFTIHNTHSAYALFIYNDFLQYEDAFIESNLNSTTQRLNLSKPVM